MFCLVCRLVDFQGDIFCKKILNPSEIGENHCHVIRVCQAGPMRFETRGKQKT